MEDCGCLILYFLFLKNNKKITSNCDGDGDGDGDGGRWSDSLKLLTTAMNSPILTVTKQLASATIDFAEQSFDFGMTLALRFWATGNPELIFQCILALPTAQEAEAIGNVFFLNSAILYDATSGERISIAAECQVTAGNRLTRTQQNSAGACLSVKLGATCPGFSNSEPYSNVSYTLKPF